MTIQENINLLPYNTFRISARARYFTTIHSLADMQSLLQTDLFRENRHLILGGGSNILLTGDFEGLVIKNEIAGITTDTEDERTIRLRVGAGENWHGLVMHCVERDLGGIENLSLIPGTAGAAPIQNIGAYGVEVKEVIHHVEALDLHTGEVRHLSNAECAFGYRDSIFKQELKNRFFISSITLTLTKKDHNFRIHYGSIADVIGREIPVGKLSVKAISDAVIHIRRSKLPDPAVIGNAGSFFKNPTVEQHTFESIRQKFPGVPAFPDDNGRVKIPAAWLIEQCGWKGKTLDNIGVHKDQALVLVNFGGGEGKKIWELATNIQTSVKQKFNITLQPEVNVI